MPVSDERTPLLINAHASNGLDAPPPAEADPKAITARKRWTILFAVWLGVALGALDTTLVATLVSSISSSFDASNRSSWLGTSYLLTLASFTPLYGRLSDIYGRRAANLLSLLLFGVGTLGCGLSPSMNWLIASRAIAGCGAGGMMSTSSIIASGPSRLIAYLRA